MREERAAELIRVLAVRMGEFVDEALHEERVLAVPGRAPRSERNVGVGQHRLDAQIGNA